MVVAYPPRITNRLPRNIRTRTGVALQLPCVALGVPRPEVTWEMPDHSLFSGADIGRMSGIQSFHPRGTLVIQNPQTSDSGIYKCTAKNPLGSDYATTYIQVIWHKRKLAWTKSSGQNLFFGRSLIKGSHRHVNEFEYIYNIKFIIDMQKKGLVNNALWTDFFFFLMDLKTNF